MLRKKLDRKIEENNSLSKRLKDHIILYDNVNGNSNSKKNKKSSKNTNSLGDNNTSNSNNNIEKDDNVDQAILEKYTFIKYK